MSTSSSEMQFRWHPVPGSAVPKAKGRISGFCQVLRRKACDLTAVKSEEQDLATQNPAQIREKLRDRYGLLFPFKQ
jgi:hypothetical protein